MYHMSFRLTFEFVGSYGDIYEVVATGDGLGPTVVCSCSAGRRGRYCRHRIALLTGRHDRLASGHEQLPTLKALLRESDLAGALADYVAAEAAHEAAASRRRNAARELGRLMHDAPANPCGA